MKHLKKYLIILLSVLLYQCGPYESSREVISNVDEMIRKTESSLSGPVVLADDKLWTIDERMEHYGVPGLSLAVIKDNEIHWAKSYGVMDKDTKELVTNETLFQAGSISKPVAAYGAMKLVEEGKIDLDEDINTYLVSWKLPGNEFTEEKVVTLRHLLSHTGGVTVHGFLGYNTEEDVPTLVQVLNGDGPANSAPILVDKLPEERSGIQGAGIVLCNRCS